MGSTLLELGYRLAMIERDINQLAGETEGEITPELQALLDEQLQAEMESGGKLDKYAYFLERLERDIEILKGRKSAIDQRIRTKSRALTAAVERLHTYMRMRDIKKVEGDFYTFTRQYSGKAPVIVPQDLDVNHIPVEFTRTKVELDKRAVRDALESGRTLDWAQFGDRTETIRRR